MQNFIRGQKTASKCPESDKNHESSDSAGAESADSQKCERRGGVIGAVLRWIAGRLAVPEPEDEIAALVAKLEATKPGHVALVTRRELQMLPMVQTLRRAWPPIDFAARDYTAADLEHAGEAIADAAEAEGLPIVLTLAQLRAAADLLRAGWAGEGRSFHFIVREKRA